MVNVMTRHAAHVAAVMFSTSPLKTRPIARVTHETLVIGSCPGFLRCQLDGIVDVVGSQPLLSIRDVLRAIAVAAFASSRP